MRRAPPALFTLSNPTSDLRPPLAEKLRVSLTPAKGRRALTRRPRAYSEQPQSGYIARYCLRFCAPTRDRRERQPFVNSGPANSRHGRSQAPARHRHTDRVLPRPRRRQPVPGLGRLEGRPWVVAKAAYEAQTAELRQELDGLRQERERWQRRVEAMRSESVDRDLVEEEAHTRLDRAYKDEVVIFLDKK